MVMKTKEMLWNEQEWSSTSTYQNAIFLCVALGFDTGRRIGNLCHADGKSAEDHCIRTKDVIFVFESLERSMQAGPEFRKFYHQNNMQLESITSAKLYFHSQKSKHINHVRLTAPVILDRINPLFTRRLPGERAKLLIQRDVRKAMKEVAEGQFNIEASRISSRSLRSGFVTLTAATKANDTNSSETTFSRGGWSNKSDVPRRFYDKNPRDQGALACDPKQFNSQHVRLLTPRAIESVGIALNASRNQNEEKSKSQLTNPTN
jgi:hypothetical protein